MFSSEENPSNLNNVLNYAIAKFPKTSIKSQSSFLNKFTLG